MVSIKVSFILALIMYATYASVQVAASSTISPSPSSSASATASNTAKPGPTPSPSPKKPSSAIGIFAQASTVLFSIAAFWVLTERH